MSEQDDKIKELTLRLGLATQQSRVIQAMCDEGAPLASFRQVAETIQRYSNQEIPLPPFILGTSQGEPPPVTQEEPTPPSEPPVTIEEPSEREEQ